MLLLFNKDNSRKCMPTHSFIMFLCFVNSTRFCNSLDKKIKNDEVLDSGVSNETTINLEKRISSLVRSNFKLESLKINAE